MCKFNDRCFNYLELYRYLKYKKIVNFTNSCKQKKLYVLLSVTIVINVVVDALYLNFKLKEKVGS